MLLKAVGVKVWPRGPCAGHFTRGIESAEAYSYELASQGIESVIVEPGAYETPAFGNTVPAKAGRKVTAASASRRSSEEELQTELNLA